MWASKMVLFMRHIVLTLGSPRIQVLSGGSLVKALCCRKFVEEGLSLS